jgi:hypothetical protein
VLREYVYLDRNRVEDFLSQLEGGVSDSTRETETERGAEVDAGLNVGIAKIGSKLTAPTLSQEDLRRTTDVALFERLYGHLDHARGMIRVDGLDDLDFGSVRQGDLIELECDVVVAGIAKLSRQIQEMQAWAPLMGDSIEGADQLRALFGEDIAVRFVLDEDVVAYSTLSHEGIRGDVSEIEGECTALVRVRKTVKAGKRVPLRKFAGVKLSVQQIEEMFAGMKLDDAPPELDLHASAADAIANGPSLIVTAVAIYR